jgi:chemotaxis response regulator CheB
MPKAAFETGAIDYVEPLPKIADRIIDIVNKRSFATVK